MDQQPKEELTGVGCEPVVDEILVPPVVGKFGM
jgi:hypothetical protein